MPPVRRALRRGARHRKHRATPLATKCARALRVGHIGATGAPVAPLGGACPPSETVGSRRTPRRFGGTPAAFPAGTPAPPDRCRETMTAGAANRRACRRACGRAPRRGPWCRRRARRARAASSCARPAPTRRSNQDGHPSRPMQITAQPYLRTDLRQMGICVKWVGARADGSTRAASDSTCKRIGPQTTRPGVESRRRRRRAASGALRRVPRHDLTDS